MDRRTFSSFSFGCRVNQAEKEMLDKQLSVLGFQFSVNNPDIYIINTCAVTRKAEREARQLIYQTKRKWPKTKVIVTGCAATKWINDGIKAEGVDLIVDNTDKEYIVSLLNAKFKSLSQRLISLGLKNSKLQFKIQNYKDKFLNSGRLLLKIQDGCQRFCTFCIVPYLRGQPKSVPIVQLVNIINEQSSKDTSDGGSPGSSPGESHDSSEVEESENIKEVILTAINTQAYGYDTGESFIDLVKSIIRNTKVPRISFGSIHPWSINTEFIELYRRLIADNRLVRFFHIPLQSGSNKILTLMKRGYTREEFIEKLETIEKIYPLTFIGTDIICGFLEETDRDFEDTYNFLKDSPISKFHVFRFSKREKTAAFYMSKRLKEPTPSEKSKRAKALIQLSTKRYHQFLQKHVGKTFPALFLERRVNGLHEALLDNQIPVYIKNDNYQTGDIHRIVIKKLDEGRLIGKII